MTYKWEMETHNYTVSAHPLFIIPLFSTGGSPLVYQLPIFHTCCLNILRHVFELQDPVLEHIAGLCLISHVLGQPRRGQPNRLDGSVLAPGRWPRIYYARTPHDAIDVDGFYHWGLLDHAWRFDWTSFDRCGFAWALTKPHM